MDLTRRPLFRAAVVGLNVGANSADFLNLSSMPVGVRKASDIATENVAAGLKSLLEIG